MSSPLPRLSVIVPAYNHENYVEESLNSIRDEGYPNLEIVVIDDGSTDDTWLVIDRWRLRHGDRIDVLAERQENMGLTPTLNRLLNLAHGPYVAMLASDDRLLQGGLAPRVHFLETHPDVVAVFADCRQIDSQGAVTAEHVIGFGDPRARERFLADPAREIVERWSVPGPVIVYRRAGVLAIGGYSEELRLEDWDLYLRLASRDAIAYMDRVVAEYRWHGENTVAQPAQEIRLAEELRHVAWRSRKLFRGHLYLELVHETATLAAKVAHLRSQHVQWLCWKAASVAMKLIAMAVPRRPTDQVGRPISQ